MAVRLPLRSDRIGILRGFGSVNIFFCPFPFLLPRKDLRHPEENKNYERWNPISYLPSLSTQVISIW